MTNISQNTPDQHPSISGIFKIIDHGLRRQILEILSREKAVSFKSLTRLIGVEKAALAYHLRILKKAGLIENFYDRIENSRSHSYYKLTAFSNWLITHDLKLSMESQLFRPPLSGQILDEMESLSFEKKDESGINIRYDNDREEPGKVRAARTLSEISTRSLTKHEENVRMRDDPRIRTYNYRIKVKQ